MRTVILSPEGKAQYIRASEVYRAAKYLFDSDQSLYDRRAQYIVDTETPIGYADFLVTIGYAILDRDALTLPAQLTDHQKAYIKVYLLDFSDKQRELMVANGILETAALPENKSDYYQQVWDSINDRFYQPLLDTNGNTHDYNGFKYNAEYGIRKLAEADNIEDADERKKAIDGIELSLRIKLFELFKFGEGEMRPIRLRERLTLMNYWEKNDKLYDYLKKKRENIKCLLGMEEAVCNK